MAAICVLTGVVTLTGCSNIRANTRNEAERGIVSEARASTTLLEDLLSQSTGPITAQALLDGQVVAALATTEGERAALPGGNGRVAFGLETLSGSVAVDLFVESQASTQQGLDQASSALFGCARITVDPGFSRPTLNDIDCPSWLGVRYGADATEVSIEELSALHAEKR